MSRMMERLGWAIAGMAALAAGVVVTNVLTWPRIRPAEPVRGRRNGDGDGSRIGRDEGSSRSSPKWVAPRDSNPSDELSEVGGTPSSTVVEKMFPKWVAPRKIHASEVGGTREFLFVINELHAPRVSVLVPARDEEDQLPACLEALLDQAFAAGRGEAVDPVLEVLVYDDRSTDDTAGVVERFAARDGRVRLVRGGPLPDGWCGKPHALARLADEARGDWLLFVDADTRLEPGAVAAIVRAARDRGVHLLAPWPGIDLESPVEALLMPMLGFVVLGLFPTFLQTMRQDVGLGLAHGATILVDAAAYRSIGGHGAVRDEIFEDTALARAMRRAGLRTLCLDGRMVTRVRMYGSFDEIWNGFVKNFYPAFRRRSSFWLFVAGRFTVFLLPFPMLALALTTGEGRKAAPWAAAAALAIGARALLAVRFREPIWSAFAHPVAEGVLLALGLTSWRRVASGRGVEWKGRVYRSAGTRESREERR